MRGWEGLRDIGVNVACKQDNQSMAGAISLEEGYKAEWEKERKRKGRGRKRKGLLFGFDWEWGRVC
jgi:hypothetical protein